MVLLNNFIRQAQTFVNNMDNQEGETCSKMKSKLLTLAEEQKITLFEEEEDVADPTLITQTLVQDICDIGLDLVSDLIKVNSSLRHVNCHPQAPPVQLSIDLKQLKEMQINARKERKACH